MLLIENIGCFLKLRCLEIKLSSVKKKLTNNFLKELFTDKYK